MYENFLYSGNLIPALSTINSLLLLQYSVIIGVVLVFFFNEAKYEFLLLTVRDFLHN